MLNLEEIKDDIEMLLRNVGVNVKKGFESKNKEFTTKSSANDLLTKFDIETNAAILKHLEEKYPSISIISEEAEEISKVSEYAFVVDPIDGTRNFVRNIPVFFIGIGLVKNGKPILSVTFNPVTEELFWAIKGQGAFKNNVKINVGNRTLELSDIVVRTLPDKKLEGETVSKIVENVWQVKNNMCCHEEISGVAYDRYDGFVSKGSSPWDYCHCLLVEEAGGRVTDWNGEEFNISKDNIIASNGIIHDELLKFVAV